MTNDDTKDPRKALPRYTLVIWHGKLYRTIERIIVSVGKPGIKRVKYVLEPGRVSSQGTPVFNIFRFRDTPVCADELEVVAADRVLDFDLGHKAL